MQLATAGGRGEQWARAGGGESRSVRTGVLSMATTCTDTEPSAELLVYSYWWSGMYHEPWNTGQ